MFSRIPLYYVSFLRHDDNFILSYEHLNSVNEIIDTF